MSIEYEKLTESFRHKLARENSESKLLSEQVAILAERQINIIQMCSSINSDSDTSEWAIVEFSIGNGKWTKFCIKNNKYYASAFIEYIIEVVSQAREQMQIKY